MNNLEKYLKQQEDLRLEQQANQKPLFFNSFDQYNKMYPESEGMRRMTGDGILLATYEGQSCLNGDYYIAKIIQYRGELGNKCWVIVNNGDDGYVKKELPNLQNAQQELENLKLLAPFYYGDLIPFGYYWD